MKHVACLTFCLAVFAVFAEKQPFERYQSILDRQMFGPLPPGFDPTKSPNEVQKSSVSDKQLTQEQEKLQSAIHFSAINVASDGATAVGFTDNTDPKVPRHYYLKVGESRDGWTVKEADPQKATMTVVKDDIEVSLSLGGNSAKGGGATTRADGSMASRRSSGLLGGSLRQRRMMRRQEEAAAQAKAAEEARAREAERQAVAEQEKQRHEAALVEQRQQLLAIQEELRRVREQKAADAAAGAEGKANGQSAENDAQ